MLRTKILDNNETFSVSIKFSEKIGDSNMHVFPNLLISSFFDLH